MPTETFMVLIIVGTLVLIFMMKGSSYSSGGCGGHPSQCECQQCRYGLIGLPRDGLKGLPRDGLKGLPRDGLKGLPRDGLKGMPYENFAGGQSSSGNVNNLYSWGDDESSSSKYLNTEDIAAKCAAITSNYQDAMKCMSLEPAVSSSHQAWIGNIQGKTSTASKESVRDDPNDVNPWMGLRRPKYKTRAQPLAEARTIASDVPNEMLDYSGSYTL